MDTTGRILRTAALTAATVAAVDWLAKAVVRGTGAHFVHRADNPGLITGWAPASMPVIIGLTILALVCFVGVVGRWSAHIGVSPVLSALVAGGILSHVVERLWFGHVRDFLATGWLIVDLADIAIVAGISGLGIASAIRLRDLRRRHCRVTLDVPRLAVVVVNPGPE